MRMKVELEKIMGYTNPKVELLNIEDPEYANSRLAILLNIPDPPEGEEVIEAERWSTEVMERAVRENKPLRVFGVTYTPEEVKAHLEASKRYYAEEAKKEAEKKLAVEKKEPPKEEPQWVKALRERNLTKRIESSCKSEV